MPRQAPVAGPASCQPEKCSAGIKASRDSRLGTNLYNILLYLPGTYQVVPEEMRRDHDTAKPRKSCRRTLSLLSLLLYIIITRHPAARWMLGRYPGYLCAAPMPVSAPGAIT